MTIINTDTITARTLITEVPGTQKTLIRAIRYYTDNRNSNLANQGISMLIKDVVSLSMIGQYQSRIEAVQLHVDTENARQRDLLENLLCTIEVGLKGAVSVPDEELNAALLKFDRAVAGAVNALTNKPAAAMPEGKARPVRRDAEICTIAQKLLDELDSGTTTNPTIVSGIKELATALRSDAAAFGIESAVPSYLSINRFDDTLAEHWAAARQLAANTIHLTERIVNPVQSVRFGVDDRDRLVAGYIRRIVQVTAGSAA